jgi:mannosyl-oligosaccharide alpha-1,2-mannosidase
LTGSDLVVIEEYPWIYTSCAPPDQAKATAVRNEFLRGWNGYKRFAFGRDEVHPVSGTASEFFAAGRPVGLSIVEALDTLYVMELDTELATATSWIQNNLSFDIDANFHVFEAIIRLVGGLLAGHLCSKQPFLLAKARDIADRLLPAFTKSPTGIPFTQVNLRTGAVSGNTPPLAEVGRAHGPPAVSQLRVPPTARRARSAMRCASFAARRSR